jgi:hypothetical protein
MASKVAVTAAEIAAIVDEACAGGEAYFDIGGRLQNLAGEPDPANPLAPFVLAFHYDLIEKRSERRDEYGPYAPVVESDSHAWPPRLENLPEASKNAWAEVVPLVTAPAAAARLHDLLWVARHGQAAYRHAQAAADAYCRQADTWVDLAAAECLIRALELALETNDTVRVDAVATKIATTAAAALAAGPEKPGVSLRLIEALIDTPTPLAEVDTLLDAAALVYAANAHISDTVADLRVGRTTDQAAISALRREQLGHWFAEAERAGGLVAIAHLQHGLELAVTHGLSAEADDFRRALQALDRDASQFERFEVEAAIDPAVIEGLLASLVVDDWTTSLQSFGATGPPTGDSADNERLVEQLMRDYPLSYLFGRVMLGPENTVIKNIAGHEAQFAAQLTAHERQQIEFWGRIAAEGLRRIAERHGRPSRAELISYFAGGVVSPECADAFARGIELYLDERYDECALVVVPRIEAAVRELARGAGLVVIREPRGEKSGGVRSLGEVLRSLRPFLDESWWRYLWNTLADPLGLNLRNRLAHGLSGGGPTTSALLLHIACFLPLLRSQD